MEKIVEEGLLYDFYGQLLTQHQRDVYEKAVYQDLSLAEIAQIEGVSKQAVHDLMRRCTMQMQEYENRLGLIGKFHSIRSKADALTEAAREDSTREELAEKVLELAEEIKRNAG